MRNIRNRGRKFSNTLWEIMSNGIRLECWMFSFVRKRGGEMKEMTGTGGRKLSGYIPYMSCYSKALLENNE